MTARAERDESSLVPSRLVSSRVGRRGVEEEAWMLDAKCQVPDARCQMTMADQIPRRLIRWLGSRSWWTRGGQSGSSTELRVSHGVESSRVECTCTCRVVEQGDQAMGETGGEAKTHLQPTLAGFQGCFSTSSSLAVLDSPGLRLI